MNIIFLDLQRIKKYKFRYNQKDNVAIPGENSCLMLDGDRMYGENHFN